MKIIGCKIVPPRHPSKHGRKYHCRKTKAPGVYTYTYLSSGIQLTLKLTDQEILWISAPQSFGYYPKFEKHLDQAFDMFLKKISS